MKDLGKTLIIMMIFGGIWFIFLALMLGNLSEKLDSIDIKIDSLKSVATEVVDEDET